MDIENDKTYCLKTKNMAIIFLILRLENYLKCFAPSLLWRRLNLYIAMDVYSMLPVVLDIT